MHRIDDIQAIHGFINGSYLYLFASMLYSDSEAVKALDSSETSFESEARIAIELPLSRLTPLCFALLYKLIKTLSNASNASLC